MLICSQPLKIALPMHVLMSLLTVMLWSMRGINRAPDLTLSPMRLFLVLLSTNSTLKLFHIPSAANLADPASRSLSLADVKLSGDIWSETQAAFGGDSGHTIDRMALQSNVTY